MSELLRLLRARRPRLAVGAALALVAGSAAAALAGPAAAPRAPAAAAVTGITGTRAVACSAGTLAATRTGAASVRVSCSAAVTPVGRARTSTSAQARTVARTGLPGGTVPGTLLVASVQAPATSAVTMAGWTRAYEAVAGRGAGALRLSTWWRIAREGETAPSAALNPAGGSTMITAGFGGADARTPVAAAAATAGSTGATGARPAPVAGAGQLDHAVQGGGSWVIAVSASGRRVRLTPPAASTRIASVSNGRDVRTAVATAPVPTGDAASPRWGATGARAVAAGALVVRPAAVPLPAGAISVGAGAGQEVTCATGPVSYTLIGATAVSIVCPPAPPTASAPGATPVSTTGTASTGTSSTGTSSTGTSSTGTSSTGTSSTGTASTGTASTGSSVTSGPAPASSPPIGTTTPPAGATSGGGTTSTGTAPAAPAVVCDSAALAGPATAPAGAVSVTLAQNLADVVRAHGPGTTYWLAPGTHVLGPDQFAQVQPHDGDAFIGAPGAVLDGQRINRYAFTTEASKVAISHLTVQHFGPAGGNPNEGVVNHDSGRYWTITANTIQDNAGAGLMIGPDNQVTGNCLRRNGQYGFNGFYRNGDHDVVLAGNEIAGNNTDNWEQRQPGCGCTGGGKFWATRGARITGNYVHDNHGVGLWADSNNTDFLVQGNYISGNDSEGLMYETSYNATILDNTFVRNAIVAGPGNPGFPVGAIYLSEAGGDARVAGAAGATFRIAGNVFTDNWAGIVAWENADRFAGSPANSSTGMTTLVNPGVATVQACGTASLIVKAPYLSDCRWKTQNLLVEKNTFTLDAAHIAHCTASNGCGFNGLFSNYGSSPNWSPYQGAVVEDNITHHQNNVWQQNTYHGPWTFMAHDQATKLGWSAWRSAPYQQDAGSIMD